MRNEALVEASQALGSGQIRFKYRCGSGGGRCVNRDSRPCLNLKFCRHIALVCNPFLQRCDLLLSGGIDALGVRLRTSVQGDWRRTRALRQLMPQFLGEKRHEGMKQPQSALESRE